MGSFDFAVELRCPWLNVDMLDALIFMPVETGLKLMTPIRPDCADPARKLFDHIVHELDSTILVVV